MAWRASEQAALDLQHIAEDGILNFGAGQARNYTGRMLDMFETLAAHPDMARERQAASSIIRLMPYGKHNILYVIEAGDIVILRVLHGLQNWFDLL